MPWDPRSSRYFSLATAIPTILVLVFLSYAFCYLALVERVVYPATSVSITHGETHEFPVARYRWGGSHSEALFGPAHWLDEHVRQAKWRVNIIEYPLP